MFFEKTIWLELRMKYDKILLEDSELRRGTKKYLNGRRELALINVIDATEHLKLVFPLLESDEPDWNKIRKTEEYIEHTTLQGYGSGGIIEYIENLVTQTRELTEKDRRQNKGS